MEVRIMYNAQASRELVRAMARLELAKGMLEFAQKRRLGPDAIHRAALRQARCSMEVAKFLGPDECSIEVLYSGRVYPDAGDFKKTRVRA